MTGRLAIFGACLMLWASGCTPFPIEPGTDLPEDAPPAVLSGGDGQPDPGADPLPDAPADDGADITGSFEIVGELDNPLGDPIGLTFLTIATQQGAIPSGSATVNLDLRNPDTPDTPGPSFDQPATISSTGAFSGDALGLVIPQSFSDLLAADANADVSVEAQIIDSDCFAGAITLQLKDALVAGLDMPLSIPLSGTFQATRQGAMCSF